MDTINTWHAVVVALSADEQVLGHLQTQLWLIWVLVVELLTNSTIGPSPCLFQYKDLDPDSTRIFQLLVQQVGETNNK